MKRKRTPAQIAATKRMIAANKAKRTKRRNPLPSKKTKRVAGKCVRTWTGKHTHVARVKAHKRRTNPATGAQMNPRRKARRNPAVAANPRRRRHSYRRRRNPSIDLKGAMTSIMMGGLAAVVGIAGVMALNKAGITSKAGMIGANLGAAVVGGGLVGLFDHSAGVVLANSYTTAALKWVDLPGMPTQSAAPKVQGLLPAYGNGNGYPQMGGIVVPDDYGVSGPVGEIMYTPIDGLDGAYADQYGNVHIAGIDFDV